MTPRLNELSRKGSLDPTKIYTGGEGTNKVLLLLEQGRINQLLGGYPDSVRNFSEATQSINEIDDRAVISMADIGNQGAALILNDNTIAYAAYGYERVMLNHFQAINYLFQGDLEAAGVEIRRANFEQVEALKRHEDEVAQTTSGFNSKKIAFQQDGDIMQVYAGLDEIAGKVKNSFQNAYTFFLSGVVYEMLGSPNDAYIDYKKALEIFPHNRYILRDVRRLAKQLGMDEDLAELSRRFASVSEPEGIMQKNGSAGELIVLFEDGFVTPKKEIKMSLPVIADQEVHHITFAFPVYKTKWVEPRPLSISTSGRQFGRTQPLCHVNALAVKALKEKVPGIVFRQILRSLAKTAAAKSSEKKLGPGGRFLSQVYNLASENADLRSWLSLPENAQIMRTYLPAGSHQLSLGYDNSDLKKDIEVTVAPRSLVLLHVARIGQRLIVHHKTFEEMI